MSNIKKKSNYFTYTRAVTICMTMWKFGFDIKKKEITNKNK